MLALEKIAQERRYHRDRELARYYFSPPSLLVYLLILSRYNTGESKNIDIILALTSPYRSE